VVDPPYPAHVHPVLLAADTWVYLNKDWRISLIHQSTTQAALRRVTPAKARQQPRWTFHFVTVTVDFSTVHTARQTASIIVASVRCSPVRAMAPSISSPTLCDVQAATHFLTWPTTGAAACG